MPARLTDPDAFLRAGRNRAVQMTCGAAFALYLVYHLTRFRLADVWPLAPTGDAAIMYEYAASIFARAAYDPATVFPYSPSAVVLFRALGAAGPAAFMIAWYFMMVSGLVIAVRAALTQERPDVRAAWPLIGIVAILLTGAAVSWDLRNANSNIIYLALVMAGYGWAARRPLTAGALVGLSVSLKLYSGLILGWLAVNGPRRTFHAGAAAMVLLWIVLPAALFGVGDTIELYAGWKAQVERIGDLSFHAELLTMAWGPPLVTLHRAVAHLTGDSIQSAQTIAWVWLCRGVWIAALLWYAWRCRNALFAAIPSRAALADWTVLLLAPLPLSPWLEPYHAIPLLIGAVLCIAIVLDDSPPRDRLLALAALGTLGLFLVARVPFGARGLGLLAQFLAMTVVLGLLRPRLPRTSTGRDSMVDVSPPRGPSHRTAP
jgi:hypothetical protein